MKAIYLVENPGSLKAVYSAELREELKALCGVDTILSKGQLEEYREQLTDTEYIFSTWTMPALSEEQIAEYLPSLKAVFYAAGSVQAFARPFLNRGIQVFSAWAANAVPVAEYTVAQIILANKGFFRNVQICKTRRSECGRLTTSHRGNYGCSVGLIGCGMIGSLVAEMLKAYHLKVLAYDPFMSAEKAARLGVEQVDDLMTLFKECTVVSNHLANNAQTKGMIHYDMFAAMTDYGTFINTGRGAQVVEADMVRALSERPTLTAVLDVTDPEPPLADSPMLEMDNIILTSHIAGSQQDEFHRMSEYMKDEYLAFVNDQPTKYSVTLKMLETMA
ncbi:MAG: hydroxyacid dehydrogenase [Ruminococcaceae bacterium]|nr:hydroxyacid dehydrogenase [Oscillospiraceae bacterium]